MLRKIEVGRRGFARTSAGGRHEQSSRHDDSHSDDRNSIRKVAKRQYAKNAYPQELDVGKGREQRSGRVFKRLDGREMSDAGGNSDQSKEECTFWRRINPPEGQRSAHHGRS